RPGAVESTKPSDLGAAGGRWSATDAAKRNAEAASLLGLHPSSALFPDGDILASPGIRSDKGKLAGNEVGDANFRRRHSGEHRENQSGCGSQRWQRHLSGFERQDSVPAE